MANEKLTNQVHKENLNVCEAIETLVEQLQSEVAKIGALTEEQKQFMRSIESATNGMNHTVKNAINTYRSIE